MNKHEYEENEVSMEIILKRISPWFGFGLAIISIYFSYDGLDQTVTGGNPAYTEIAKYIGWVMAIAVTLIQFIFNSDFARLNSTLRVVGIVSYGYSLYTNYLGLEHLFGFHGLTGIAVAIFMDVTPEAIIAWSLEEETQGDMIGNIGKWITGNGSRRFKRGGEKKFASNTTTATVSPSVPRKSTISGHDRRAALENEREELLKRRRAHEDNQGRFSGFGE